MKIDPVIYNYNGILNTPTDREIVGIIAQELQAVAPYMVKKVNVKLEPNNQKSSETMEVLSVNTSAMQYMTVNAIKELNNKISVLEATLESLKGILDSQQKEINRLKEINDITKRQGID